MRVFYETYGFVGPGLNYSDVIEQREKATVFAEKVMGTIINITEVHTDGLFSVTIWYRADRKAD